MRVALALAVALATLVSVPAARGRSCRPPLSTAAAPASDDTCFCSLLVESGGGCHDFDDDPAACADAYLPSGFGGTTSCFMNTSAVSYCYEGPNAGGTCDPDGDGSECPSSFCNTVFPGCEGCGTHNRSAGLCVNHCAAHATPMRTPTPTPTRTPVTPDWCQHISWSTFTYGRCALSADGHNPADPACAKIVCSGYGGNTCGAKGICKWAACSCNPTCNNALFECGTDGDCGAYGPCEFSPVPSLASSSCQEYGEPGPVSSPGLCTGVHAFTQPFCSSGADCAQGTCGQPVGVDAYCAIVGCFDDGGCTGGLHCTSGLCGGPAQAFHSCLVDSDCVAFGGGACFSACAGNGTLACNTCRAGANAGNICYANSDCPGSDCWMRSDAECTALCVETVTPPSCACALDCGPTPTPFLTPTPTAPPGCGSSPDPSRTPTPAPTP